jgi:hypothetical protein
MENEYPKAMYRPGSEYELAGGSFDFRVVSGVEEEVLASEEGWACTPVPPDATDTRKPKDK